MDRYRSVEVLLRVLAFGDRREKYEGNLAKFLNVYMHDQTDTSNAGDDLKDKLGLVAARAKAVLSSTPQTKLPLLIMEALMVALYSHRKSLEERSDDELFDAYKEMLARPSFAEGARYAVSSESNVAQRLAAAVESFAPK